MWRNFAGCNQRKREMAIKERPEVYALSRLKDGVRGQEPRNASTSWRKAKEMDSSLKSP